MGPKRPKTKANHALDHVDDRPRARADGGAQTIAPIVARGKTAPPVPPRGRRRQSPLGLFIRGRRGSDDERGRPLRLVRHELGGHCAPPSPRKPPAPEFGTTLLAHRRPGGLRGADADLMLYVLGYLDPKARHRAAANPACRQRDRVTKNREVWAHLCSSTPWRIHRSDRSIGPSMLFVDYIDRSSRRPIVWTRRRSPTSRGS